MAWMDTIKLSRNYKPHVRINLTLTFGVFTFTGNHRRLRQVVLRKQNRLAHVVM